MKINKIENYIVDISSSIDEALQKLNKNNFKILFVCEKGILKGSLSDGDIRRYLVSNKNQIKIKDCMNKTPLFIQKDTKQYDLRKSIIENNVYIVPVVDKDHLLIKIIDLRIDKYFPVDVVIMAGGRGQRLSPLTNNLPKPLIPIDGKPIIDYNFDNLLKSGVNSFFISVNYLKEMVIEHFQKKPLGESIKFVEEDKPLGTFGSLSLISNFEHDNILVINSDILTNVNFQLFYEKFLESKCDIGLISIEYSSKIPYATLIEKDLKLLGFEEKPTYNYLINTGIYLMNRKAISRIPKNKFYNATDLLKEFLNNKDEVYIHKVKNYWRDIGKIDDLNKAKRDVLNIFNND
jgi:dTDP-glucose pyrophosphorylase